MVLRSRGSNAPVDVARSGGGTASTGCLCQAGQPPAVTEKGLMSPTTFLAYVRIISF